MNTQSDAYKRPAASLSYLPQLDSIRAIAVLSVVWHHWCGTPDDPLGPIGVWTFFVISGFLITRILLESRSDSPWESRRALIDFYVRRFLRIFPLYYFVLLLSFAMSAAFRPVWGWYALYLQNIKMMLSTGYVYAIHLWSLAVEEQFYVLWPLIVLFLPRLLLLPIVWSAIALAVVSRCFYTGMGWAPFQVNIFTVDNLDTLALGALLAYLVTYRRDKVVLTRRIALGAGVAMFFVMTILRIPILSAGLFQLGTGLVALWVVSNVADGVGGPVGRVLSFRPLLYIGRISYGIYVYHLFVPKEMHQLLRRFPAAEHGILFVAICFVVMMAISSLSWFLLENPINSLKNKFRGSARRSNPKSNAFENELLVNAMQSRLAA